MQKTQTLELFKMNIKTEIIYKSYLNDELGGLVQRSSGLIKIGKLGKRNKQRWKNCFD
jgi:hypothetical protein